MYNRYMFIIEMRQIWLEIHFRDRWQISLLILNEFERII